MTMPHVVYKPSSTLRHQQEAAFKDNGFEAHLGAVTCFLAKYDFVYGTKTNEATSGGVRGGDRVHGQESPISSRPPSR